MRRLAIALIALTMLGGANQAAFAHCQIPCGIYGDDIRFALLREHIDTVEKSMRLIGELSQNPGKNANQLIRWTTNKEFHADEFKTIITEYFLQQRITPVEKGEEEYDGYIEKVTLCHGMLVNVMKTKQTLDLEYIEQLRKQVDAFEEAYYGKEMDHKHDHVH